MELDCLETTRRESVSIFNTGTPNKADGPDFLNAHIQIGKLQWFGDIEIHWNAGDWVQHGHHTDPNYNRVVLHVVWNSDKATEVFRQDHSRIPTLILGDSLPKPLRSFLNQYAKPDVLPCSGHLSFISEKAFKKQLDIAEQEYFEQKVNDLFSFWDASLPPSKAWLNMLAAGLFDGLGISHNREPMRNLCCELYPVVKKTGSKSALLSLALAKAAVHSGKYNWTHKGSRPANHPRVRIPQAASCLWFIHQRPFKTWLQAEPEELWEELNAHITTHPGLGRQRKDILFGTVWLPSFFILGSIFASKPIQTKAFELWQNHRVNIPQSLLKPFNTLDIPASCYQHSLGAVYQLRSYCQPRHCERCEVFKSVISS